MSLWLTPIGPLSEIFFLQDYWRPLSVWSFSIGFVPILLEDLIFAFATAGIASVVYKVLFRKRLEETISVPSPVVVISVLLIPAVVSVALWFLTDVNSIFAVSVGLLLLAAFIVWQRRDLLPAALVAALFFVVTVAAIYLFSFYVLDPTYYEEHLSQVWLLANTPLDTRFARIPLTELIWAFTSGLAAGPFYAFATGRRIVKV